LLELKRESKAKREGGKERFLGKGRGEGRQGGGNLREDLVRERREERLKKGVVGLWKQLEVWKDKWNPDRKSAISIKRGRKGKRFQLVYEGKGARTGQIA